MRKTLQDPSAVRDNEPEVTPEIQMLIDEQVRAAVEPLRATLEQVRQNRDSILREKRELEGRAVADAEAREAARPKAIDFAITKEQARDPQTYRRAKAAANAAGHELLILDAPKVKRQGAPNDVCMTDSHYHLYAPAVRGDVKAYQEHRAEAERRGLRFHVASTPDQMPDQAFAGAAS